MAVGDIVNGIFTASGVYQPAAGVEVLITFLSPTSTGDFWELTDGINDAAILPPSKDSPLGIRVPLSNSRYLKYTLGSTDGGYGGIQTK